MIERRIITSKADWLAWRRPLVTASDVGAMCGVSEYMSVLELHLIKAGIKPSPGENNLMRRGRLLEDGAVNYIKDELPDWKMQRPNVFLIDAEHRLGATPDLLLEDPEHPERLLNCQIKIVGLHVFRRWPVDSAGMAIPPAAYQLQVACESMLLDAHSGILAVLVLGEHETFLETFTIPRHAEAEAKIRATAVEFWDRVERNVLPAADFTKDAEIVAKLYPPDPAVPAPLDLTGDNRIYQLCEDWEKAKAAERAAKAQIEALKGEIADKLKGAVNALAEGWKITRKMVPRKGYTVPATEYPDLRVTRLKEAA